MRFIPPVKTCPHCGGEKPCMDERCNTQYPTYAGDELPSTSNPAVPEAPKDYAEHLYMRGDETQAQLGDKDCRNYFQPLDYSDN